MEAKLWLHLEVLRDDDEDPQDYGLPISIPVGPITEQDVERLARRLEDDEDFIRQALAFLLDDVAPPANPPNTESADWLFGALRASGWRSDQIIVFDDSEGGA